MNQARPGSHLPSIPLLKEYESLGGDLKLLDRLRQHHALITLREIYQREQETTDTVNSLRDFYGKLNHCIERGYALTRYRWLRSRTGEWLTSLKRLAADVIVEQLDRGLKYRKGLASLFPDQYFYGACLIPYTAYLNSGDGKGRPKWDWVKRWLKDAADLDVRDIQAWWRKEVTKRKSWPSQSLLYALLEGASVFLEASKGKSPDWTLEWLPSDGNRRAIVAMSSCKLKRNLSKQDVFYLKCAFEHVPLIRKNFVALYSRITARFKPPSPDPLDKILRQERSNMLKKASSASIKKKIQTIEALFRKEDFDEKDGRVLRGLLSEDWYKLAPLLQNRLKGIQQPQGNK